MEYGRKKDSMGRVGGEEMLVEFQKPDGMELEGEEGTAMVNWKMTPEGKIRITAMDGVTIGEEEMEG